MSQSVMPSAIVPVHSVAASDEIEFLGTVSCSDPESPSCRRRAAARKGKIYVDDEDEQSKPCWLYSCSIFFAFQEKGEGLLLWKQYNLHLKIYFLQKSEPWRLLLDIADAEVSVSKWCAGSFFTELIPIVYCVILNCCVVSLFQAQLTASSLRWFQLCIVSS